MKHALLISLLASLAVTPLHAQEEQDSTPKERAHRHRYRAEMPHQDWSDMGREWARMGREYGRMGREYARMYGNFGKDFSKNWAAISPASGATTTAVMAASGATSRAITVAAGIEASGGRTTATCIGADPGNWTSSGL